MASKSKTPAVTLLGYEIENKCPCGKVVSRYERQELVFDTTTQVWFRVCADCIKADRCFSGN